MFYRFDAMFILVIYVLRTCRDYLFEYFIRFHARFSSFMCCEHAVITCLSIYCFDINVIKTHFAMKTLKRVNMVMWALETKLVQPKGNGSPWLLGDHGMSPLHGGVAGTCFRVSDSTRSNPHRIMV
jgi:hypothetical protein